MSGSEKKHLQGGLVPSPKPEGKIIPTKFSSFVGQTEKTEEQLVQAVRLAIRETMFSDEFREFLEHVVEKKVKEIVHELVDDFDPDEGLNLKPEFEKYLLGLQQQDQHYTDAEDVWRELGLDEQR